MVLLSRVRARSSHHSRIKINGVHLWSYMTNVHFYAIDS